jgi:hypothetical protein
VPHHKDKTRQRMRRDSAIERERVALEMLVLGRRNVEIAEQIGVNPASVTKILQRGLERRATEEGPTVEAARALYLDGLRELKRAWMPLALGTFVIDDDTGTTVRPDPRAADIVLKILDREAAAQGREIAPAPGQTNVVNVFGSQADSLRDQIMASLANMADKTGAIQAEFAEIGTSLELASGREQPTDQPAPPTPGEEAA